ncbi:hypothetical protein ACFL12_00700 [Pseudomonadota bacterium]
MSHCTGPYTRIPFAKGDVKSARTLIEGLCAANLDVTVKRQFDGDSGLDDFNLDLEITDPTDSGVFWDLRAAKFLGRKKTLRKSFVFELSIKKRAVASNAVQWEGCLFDTKFSRLAKGCVSRVQAVLAGDTPPDLVDGDDAQLHRIELCTGTAA